MSLPYVVTCNINNELSDEQYRTSTGEDFFLDPKTGESKPMSSRGGPSHHQQAPAEEPCKQTSHRKLTQLMSADRSHITSYRTSTGEDFFLDEAGKAHKADAHDHTNPTYRTSSNADHFVSATKDAEPEQRGQIRFDASCCHAD